MCAMRLPDQTRISFFGASSLVFRSIPPTSSFAVPCEHSFLKVA